MISQVLTERMAAIGNVGTRHASVPLVSRRARLPAVMIALGLSCSGTSHSFPAYQRRVVVLVASATPEVDISTSEDDNEDIGFGIGTDIDESELGPPPAVRHQRAMQLKDRKVWRAKAETLAKERRLIKIQVGQLGITQSFLSACADILQKHSLVRVKLGEGCGLERRSAAAVLEKYLDCVCVHEIGFTITLYRQAGLPRPSNLPSTASTASEYPAGSMLKDGALAEEIAREKLVKKKAGQKRPEDRPPEFSVL